ncbi:hypothetical protein V8G54_011702 [Vigna mungo]|uniref:Uncharacterized protein n=1 Tax=Vigna mungo TaxID=3915 RepID=A0AAQ3NSF9_VIGMU
MTRNVVMRKKPRGAKSDSPIQGVACFNVQNNKGHNRTNPIETEAESEDTMEKEEEEEAVAPMVKLGSYGGEVRLMVGGEESAAEETMLLWGILQPTLSKPNAFVSQSSLQLSLDTCGHSLSILQSPSSLGTPGVTGAVMWDSGVVLGKFLEHSVDSGMLVLQGKKIVELGSGCGLVGCIAALLGGEVVVTDLPDRLRLLRKNIETNMKHVSLRGSITATELTWGEDPDSELIDPTPDFGKSSLPQPLSTA